MKLTKELQNEIIALMAKGQNSKDKMNGGQLREMQKLAFTAVACLSKESKFKLGMLILESSVKG